MKKYLIILSFILSFGCKAEKPPNIVVIMADDIGLGDVSHHVRTFMNREPIFETPAIDSLLRDGMGLQMDILRHHYVHQQDIV